MHTSIPIEDEEALKRHVAEARAYMERERLLPQEGPSAGSPHPSGLNRKQRRARQRELARTR